MQFTLPLSQVLLARLWFGNAAVYELPLLVGVTTVDRVFLLAILAYIAIKLKVEKGQVAVLP